MTSPATIQFSHFSRILDLIDFVIIIDLACNLIALQLLLQYNNKTEGRCLYLLLYALFEHSKSSAMMTVIAEVGIQVGGTWRWNWRPRRYYGMARFGGDIKVGGE